MKTDNLPGPTSENLACSNWQGELSRPSIPFSAKPVLSDGMVCLWIHGARFIVSYGLQVTSHKTLALAGADFDACRAHQRACEADE